MKFFYDMADTFNHDDYEPWTEDQVSRVRLYPWTASLEAKLAAEHSTLWPVNSPYGPSWEAAEVKDRSEARDLLFASLNQSVFERVHDL